jgi:hypothetical protein
MSDDADTHVAQFGIIEVRGTTTWTLPDASFCTHTPFSDEREDSTVFAVFMGMYRFPTHGKKILFSA